MTDHPKPSARARDLVRGGYDVHIHVAPDVMRRRIDDLALAPRFAEVGLGGFVLKSHYFPPRSAPPWSAPPTPGSARSGRSRSTGPSGA